MICTEARTTDMILDSEIRINGYDHIRSDSLTRHSGGVVVYKRSDVKSNVVHDDVSGYDNVLVLDVYDTACRGRWFLVYHSPNSPHDVFIDRLELIYDQYAQEGNKTKVCGDFNVNMHSSSTQVTHKARLERFFTLNSLKQHVKKFTRVTQQSRTIIDLFASNDPLIKIEVKSDDMIADHHALFMTKPERKPRYEKRNIVDRSGCTYEAFTDKLRLALSQRDQSENDLHSAAEFMKGAIYDSINSLTSEKSITPSYSKKWFTNELRALRADEKRSHHRAQIINDTDSWHEYR